MSTTTTATARDRYARKNEEEDLRRAFQTLDIDKDRRLSLSDLMHYLSSLNYHHISKKDLLDMIWEVDDDCDGFVDWDEFQKMYERCRNDAAGNEPRSLFNIALFAMHATTDGDGGDENSSSSSSSSYVIRADDLFKMVYLKIGAGGVETQMNDVFQLHDVNSGRAVKIQEFLTCMERQLVEQRQQMSRVSSGGGGNGGKKNGNGNGVRIGRN